MIAVLWRPLPILALTVRQFLGGKAVRVVSIRHYVQSVFVDLLDDPDVTIANATSLRASLITVAVACVLAVLLATWRLRRMNLE